MSNIVKDKNMSEEKRYPSKVLGLDISTACIGASIINDDGVNEPVIDWITHIIPKIPKGKTGIEALILRKEIFERDFLTKIKDFGITECVIESPILQSMTGSSSAQTIAQLLKFNALLSEAVYRVLGIIPDYVSSYEARMLSFPQLLSLRKFNKKGIIYPLKHIEKAIRDNHLILFGAYPFDCDKKSIMMDMVCEKYPDIEWVKDKNGKIKKENYDACDSLVCALAYSNKKRHGDINPNIVRSFITNNEKESIIEYTVQVWDKTYEKKIILNNCQ